MPIAPSSATPDLDAFLGAHDQATDPGSTPDDGAGAPLCFCFCWCATHAGA